jgi:hypothetical protein
MKKLPFICAASLAFMSVSVFAADECMKPDAPVIPDGNTATEEELLGAREKLMAFLVEGESYRSCMDEKLAALRDSHDDASKEEKGTIAKMYEALTTAYNNQVDAEQAAGDEFNKAVRAFKARSE